MEEIGNLKNRINTLRGLLKNKKGQISNSSKYAKKVVGEVSNYFARIKPALHTVTSDLDQCMQDLLRATHKNSTIKRYSNILKKVQEESNYLEQKLITNPGQDYHLIENQTDVSILQTLKRILPDAACAYEQAVLDLKDESRLSWRGPATDFREALRMLLDHLAPDETLKKQIDYKQEKDIFGPTMKQKVKYILTTRGMSATQSATSEKATNIVEDTLGLFVRSVYNRSSCSTHTQTCRSEVLRIRDCVRLVLCELLAIQRS